LLGEAGDRQLAEDFGDAAHAALPARERDAAAAARLAERVRGAGRAAREHRAAFAIEVTGEDVHDVDEPARRRPEFLRAGPDPRVDRGALRCGELARDAPDLLGRDAAHGGDPLGRERTGQLLDRSEADGVIVELGTADELLLEERVQDAE